MESMDRSTQAKAFDELQTGVKGLTDSGITQVPAMFLSPPATLTNLNPPPSQLTMPTIDLNGGVFDHQDSMITRRSVVEKIGNAAEKWGFFQVINHGIPVHMLEKMIEGIRGFHEQEPEEKKRFYSRDHQNRDVMYYTNFDILNSSAVGWRDSLVCYMAPNPPKIEDLPAVCGELMLEHSKQMKNLGELLFELLSEALGLKPNHLKEMNCVEAQMITGQYYPPCPQPDLTLGFNKHTDFSFLTILLQDNIRGLQIVHDLDWIDVPHIPGALVVNIGDLLQLITNDKFVSVEHRVIANGASVPRISVPCFFTTFMKPNAKVYGPIKELLSEENPPNYRDLTINEFANIFRSREIGTTVLSHFRI